MATLTVEEFYYRTTPNQESEETNQILSVLVTEDIEALPSYISNKPHPINRQYLNSKTLLHVFILLHPEEHISL